MRRIAILVAFLIFGFCFLASAGQPQDAKRELIIFYSPGCHACAKFKSEAMPKVEKKFKRALIITYRSIDDIRNYKMLLGLQAKYKTKLNHEVPILFLEGRFLEEPGKSWKLLESFIDTGLKTAVAQEEALAEIDLFERFKSFKPAVVCGAGLVDGINPCAFTVIVFFISFLALQGYRKRELIAIGLSFIFSVFFTYLLIGVGLFGFLFSLRGFWLFMKIFNLSIGTFSLVLGALALYDFFVFKKSGQAEGLLLQLPASVKRRIQQVIGSRYRKSGTGESAAVSKSPLIRLVTSALVTGFLVSLLEAVCTGQTYLPTIVFVLKASTLRFQALSYLVLYNLMFIIPLLIIFFLALMGTSSGQFAALLKRHMLKVKLLMALLFFALGGFLIWRA